MGRRGHATEAELERVENLERLLAEHGLGGDDLLELALMYVEPLHEEDSAIRLLKEVAQGNSDDWVARVWLAHLYLHHRMDKDALRAGQQLLSPLTHQQGGPAAAAFLLLSQIGRDLDELDARGQAALLERSVNQAPDWVLNHYLLADCYRQLGMSDAALRELSVAEANIASDRKLHSKAEREFEGAITGRTAYRIEDQLDITRQKVLAGSRV